MDWLSKNWIWILFAIGVFMMLRHNGGLGRMRRGRQYGEVNGGADGPFDTPRRLKDPVSGEEVDPANAMNSTYQGRTYYFGSRENRDKFEAAPAQYATSAAAYETHRHRRHGC